MVFDLVLVRISCMRRESGPLKQRLKSMMNLLIVGVDFIGTLHLLEYCLLDLFLLVASKLRDEEGVKTGKPLLLI